LTVAVSCNLSDGVILGVDSAVTIADSKAIYKVYENAEKLFQLGEKSIGIATFGLGGIGGRSIGSYVREFEILNPNNVIKDQNSSMEKVVEELRAFFQQQYQKTVIPAVENETKRKFEEIPDDNKPVLGLVVGGFSGGSYLSEVWQILVPFNKNPNSATHVRKEGDFGANWFSLYIPICRYMKGFDPALLEEIVTYFSKTLLGGVPLTDAERSEILKIMIKYEYQVPYGAMPIEEGIAHVKFLVEMVINHHRFSIGAPIVGGKARVGLVTYKGKEFKILN
jgi:hypothetical protein